MKVSFNASGSHDPNSGGSIKQYSFNFGDGSAYVVQTTPTVSHTYSAAANHIASVTVTDAEGGTASASVTVKTAQ
jgi:PKD repeat protein